MGQISAAGLYKRYAGELADFWGRRKTHGRFQRQFDLFGLTFTLRSNVAEVLTAVDLALPLYTQIESEMDAPEIEIQVAARDGRLSTEPPPDDLMQRITYAGDGEWLALHLGEWGQVHVDLGRGRATAVIAPSLAQRPDLFAQCVLHTILLNFIIAAGYGMLHASCLERDGHALLLLAPHNTGKSTTALRLALAGWRLLTDSMVFVSSGEILPQIARIGADFDIANPQNPRNPRLKNEGIRLLGFPVGQIKLRADMAAQFPQLRPYLTPEIVRDETKYRLDLRQAGVPVWETAVTPSRAALCLLARHDAPDTRVTAVSQERVWEAIMRNSL
ncbi:MAG TPA: hypothetical protein ENK32_10510, partial [Anaerolineae bacterium]|nr:hypothetical protein [Anaerolineae bacterium]